MESLVDELQIDSKNFTSMVAYEKQFDLIAEKLINNCVLQINDKPHRFVEIEFYYTDAFHADPFTHKDALQKTNGEWYFHKIGAQYKGGTYKGLDLTCGSPNAYGGILIRGIQDLTTQEVKDGSCVCVDHILQICNVSSIQDLTILKVFNKKATLGRGILYIDANPASNLLTKREIVKSARVGLNMKKKEDNQTKYVMKPYRYIAYPKLTKKGKIHMALSLHSSGKTPEQIQELTGSPLTSINNWIEWYNKGTKQSIKEFVNLALDNESLCRALGAHYGTAASNSPDPSIKIATTIEDLSTLPNTSVEKNLPQFRAMFSALRMQLNSYKDSEVLVALTAFRKMLSLDVSIAPIDDVYKVDLIPKFAEFLRRVENPEQQVEAAWILTNVACSPNFAHVRAIFDADVLPQINTLLSSSDEKVYDQALWLLSNMLGEINESYEADVMLQRKKAIEAGVIPSLIQLGLAEQNPGVAANIAWALDNVLHAAESVPWSQATTVLPILAKLLQSKTTESTSYSASSVARLTEKHNDKMVQQILDTNGLVETLVRLIADEATDIFTRNNSAKALANLTSGTPEQVAAIISRGLLTSIFQHYNRATDIPQLYHESVAKILEHVTLAADATMLQTIIESGVLEIGTQAAQQLETLDNYIWALSNATFAASTEQLDKLNGTVRDQLIKALLRKKVLDKELKIAVLEGLSNLLARAPEVAPHVPPEAKKMFRALASKAEEPEITALAANLAKLCIKHK